MPGGRWPAARTHNNYLYVRTAARVVLARIVSPLPPSNDLSATEENRVGVRADTERKKITMRGKKK